MASSYTQAGRPLKIDTPLGTDVLLLERISGEEGISSSYEFELEMISLNASIDPTAIVRKPAVVTILAQGGAPRYIHGMIRRFTQLGRLDGISGYRATLVPWTWMLTLWSDCKIFQQKSVPDIVEAVFQKRGFTGYRLSLMGTYSPRDYCVQYRETDFNFVSRLLEEEGIYYYFEHAQSAHTMVLVDKPPSLSFCPTQAAAGMAAKGSMSLEADVVTDIKFEYRAATDVVTMRDYNFETPSQTLEANSTGTYTEEVYDYPGRYLTQDDGETYANVRLEEQETPYLYVTGESNCRAFVSGYKITLQNHFRRDLNQDYLLVRVSHDMRTSSYRAGEQGRYDYGNRFEMIPFSTPFRPPRTAARGHVRGTQTAIVVGPSGEEIYTDQYGRVKVQFYWDRVGGFDENSSCWIRVSQELAGKNWGSIHLPRIGQEVIVDFLEGDPDRPIVTGRVYNATQMPPYTLPDNMTQSGIITRSTKGGGAANYNQIRFEDLKGSEVLLVHAEKDLTTEVENDETRTVGHSRSTTITQDETLVIQKGNRTETLQQGNDTLTLNVGNLAATLDQGNDTLTLSMGNRQATLSMGNDTLTLDLGNVSHTCSAGSYSVSAMSVSVTGNTGITLTCGASSISLTPASISITAPMVMINS